MKRFISITVFVPAREPADEEDGLDISLDELGVVGVTPRFHGTDGHGTFNGKDLVEAIEAAMRAFRDANHHLTEDENDE